MDKKKFDLTEPTFLRNFLKYHKVWNKKKLGQNFLQCRESLNKIIKLGEIKPNENIVEIGPGHGVLTRELLIAKAKVTAIEIDKSIIPALKSATHEWKDFLNIENCHILSFFPPEKHYKCIANIPYHLTSPILRKFLIDTKNKPSKMVLLMQKEVAEKIACKDDKNSLLSILVKTFGEPKYCFKVPADKFFPAPKVDSAVLEINLFKKPKINIPEKIYFEMLYSGFSSPRKKLKNILMKKFFLTNEKINNIFEKLDIDINCRAQNITIYQWESMTKEFFADYFKKI
jgi:16S rRNA (adenine1518-N6/adenine1519-N6)-dimethyltransferase